ncbi:transposase [Escherichia coli]|nr:transposase [Escherichia coli]
MEADLNWLHKESDMLTGRVDDPTMQRPLHPPKSVNRFPNHSPAMKNAYSQSSSAARRVVARIATRAKTEALRLRSPSGRVFAGPGKYAEHTTLYRQSEIYNRLRVEGSRSLLSGWVDTCCRLLPHHRKKRFRAMC